MNSFIIDKEGNITNIVFDNDPGYGIKEEVLRVLTNKRMPKWTPGKVNGEPVRSYYRLPINIQ
jgi:protein TonB